MKKLDRRVQRTQQSLGDALVSLILETGYESITIKELTQRADIGYATFFRHFKTKDDLLMYILESVLHDLDDLIESDMTPYEQACVMFEYIQANDRIYRVLIDLPRDSHIHEVVYHVIARDISQIYAPRDPSRIPMDVAINHMVTSILELVRWWLDNDMHYSPQQMATIQTELIVKATEYIALQRVSKMETVTS